MNFKHTRIHTWFRRFPEHFELNLGTLKNVKCACMLLFSDLFLLCLFSVSQYAESVSAGAGPAAVRQTELPAAAHTMPCLWSQHVVPANITRASVVGFSHTPDSYVAEIMGHSAELVAPSDPAQEHEKEREAKSNAAGGGGGGGKGRCRG